LFVREPRETFYNVTGRVLNAERAASRVLYCASPASNVSGGSGVHLVQFRSGDGNLHVGRLEGTAVADLTNPTGGLGSTLDLFVWADRNNSDLPSAVAALGQSTGLARNWSQLDITPSVGSEHLALPLEPPEVWGCGVTYRKSAEFRDEETGSPRGIYDYVYGADRPEIFFKATAARCVGPNAPVTIRADSRFTAPEPELAVVVDSRGRTLAYTVADDVSAWDIERENPLYLPQSKVFAGCCALGPALVTADEVPDPYSLVITARIRRGGQTIFEDSAETSRIRRKIDELVAYLRRDNPIPPGTVVLTGTGIIVSAEHALQPGDIVEIEIPGLGTLRHGTARGEG
jgi:2-dehydro-3-deoxy-D-arabinonate dehydratase